MDQGSLELLLGRGLTVSDIARRFGKAPSTVAYWLESYGLEPVHRAPHARPVDIDRKAFEERVAAGMTIAQMASDLGISAITVRRRLARFGLRTSRSRRRMRREDERDAGLAVVTCRCEHHGETEFLMEGRGYYRCKRCRSDRVSERRRRLKSLLVAEAGGCCRICGYDRYLGALQFHHLDPSNKWLSPGESGMTVSLTTLRAEAQKCALLCSNCHAEVEGGITEVPDKVS